MNAKWIDHYKGREIFRIELPNELLALKKYEEGNKIFYFNALLFGFLKILLSL